ncbi:DUF3090 domain-containing protein [Microbacteriaceae bacterium VKM Ac-2855]|nr:DUF3090 domain-containing protein [Microbacteriaceae bacterium VKM Ac-2855]
MSTLVHEYDWPDRVVVGTVGRPGARTFYLQARAGSRITSIALEKQQSAILAEKIDEILDELSNGSGNALTIPTSTPLELVDNEPLEQPVAEQFRAGAMGLGWDPSTAQVVIEAYALVEVEGDEVEPDVAEASEMLLVRMPVGTARAFAQRTREIVGAGRAICPRCGNPMDADGHVCPAPE